MILYAALALPLYVPIEDLTKRLIGLDLLQFNSCYMY